MYCSVAVGIPQRPEKKILHPLESRWYFRLYHETIGYRNKTINIIMNKYCESQI